MKVVVGDLSMIIPQRFERDVERYMMYCDIVVIEGNVVYGEGRLSEKYKSFALFSYKQGLSRKLSCFRTADPSKAENLIKLLGFIKKDLGLVLVGIVSPSLKEERDETHYV